jgi:ubiquinone/menaquinone biosynthesis methyltransferase
VIRASDTPSPAEPPDPRREIQEHEIGVHGAPGDEVRRMFARIAPTYDRLNHLLSAGRDRAWRGWVAESIPVDAGRVLDLCAGTGDLALEIARRRRATRVVAADFCHEMLVGGRAKGLEAAAIPAVCDALQLPFADASFDAVAVAFGVRNFERVDCGLAEIHRVLRPGGTLAVLEFFRRESRWRELPFRFYFQHVVPRLGRWVSGDAEAYSYLPRSVGQFVTRREFGTLLDGAAFEAPRWRELSGGIATLVVSRTLP